MRGSANGVVLAIHAGRCPALESVVDRVRERLADRPDFAFPRRVITKPVTPGDELHQTVTPAQFEEMRRSGQFCCAWTDGGRNFALPASVTEDLAEGRRVVVAASEAALPTLCGKARSVVLVRLLRHGEEPEPTPGLCETEVDLAVGDDIDATVQALAQRLLTLGQPAPRPRPARHHPAGKLT